MSEKKRKTDVEPSENSLPDQVLPAQEAAQAAEPESPAPPEPVRQNENEQAHSLCAIEFWASRLNIASWQQAALCRLMGWAAGKQVSLADYRQALDLLDRRRMGGGR